HEGSLNALRVVPGCRRPRRRSSRAAGWIPGIGALGHAGPRGAPFFSPALSASRRRQPRVRVARHGPTRGRRGRFPSAGGRRVTAFLTSSPLDVAALLADARASDGALCLCVGVVRNENKGRTPTATEYQAYGPMAESEMAKIAEGLVREFPETRV